MKSNIQELHLHAFHADVIPEYLIEIQACFIHIGTKFSARPNNPMKLTGLYMYVCVGMGGGEAGCLVALDPLHSAFTCVFNVRFN